MTVESRKTDVWEIGNAYERYVGRWSRLVAERFVDWIGTDAGLAWLDVGCGTGALTGVVLRKASPRTITGLDFSEGFLDLARQQVVDARVQFRQADATKLPFDDDVFDRAISGLMINFVPDPAVVVAEMRRVVRPGGRVCFYVWDYASGTQFMRYFWDAAVALDPAAGDLDEGRRFPICTPDALATMAEDVGLNEVAVDGIVIPTEFTNFEDFWTPFLGGQGPAPAYCMSLAEQTRDALKQRLADTLPIGPDGRIGLTARAWALRATA